MKYKQSIPMMLISVFIMVISLVANIPFMERLPLFILSLAFMIISIIIETPILERLFYNEGFEETWRPK
jgi:hypothetical protein